MHSYSGPLLTYVPYKVYYLKKDYLKSQENRVIDNINKSFTRFIVMLFSRFVILTQEEAYAKKCEILPLYPSTLVLACFLKPIQKHLRKMIK